MNKDIEQIFESYSKINEIAFAHQEYEQPEGEDILLGIMQQLQKAPGPLYNVPGNIIKDLIEEYASTTTNSELEILNHGLLDSDLFLLEFNRGGKNIYIMLNMEDEFIYPNVFTNFEEAAMHAIQTANKLSENDDDFGDDDFPQNPSRM